MKPTLLNRLLSSHITRVLRPTGSTGFGLATSVVMVVFARNSGAATIYWDGSGGTANDWASVNNWSTVVAGGTSPGAIPGAADLATFSATSVVTAQTVNLNGAQSVQGLSFTSGQIHSLVGGNGDRTLTLGASGITKTGTGAVTIGSATSGQQVSLVLSANQTLANNDATSALTVVNGVANNGYLLTFAGTGNTSLSGILSGSGGLTKTGSGVVTLAGANTFSGRTTVALGTLTLDYSTSDTSKLGGALTLGGGTLNLAGGSHNEVVTSTTVARGASSVTRTSGTAVLTQGVITRSAGGTVNYASGVASTSTSNVNNIVGPWATVDGANWATGTSSITAYSGYTTLIDSSSGSTSANYLVAGSLIKTRDFALNTLKLNATGAGQSLTLNSGIDIQFSRTVGGILATGSDAYTIGVTGTAGRIRSNTNGRALELVVQQFNTGGLTIASQIVNRGSGVASLTKAGPEALILTGANTFTGATTVGSGVLNIRHSTALGTTAGGVTVMTGAALELQNNIVVGAEALNLSGTGISAGGALRNISGTNTYGGLITLASDSRINSDAGTLTLSNTGTITGATFGLSVGGAGNTTINSLIGTTSGGLIKDGSGVLTLGGVNTFSGVKTLTDGILSVATIGNGGVAGNLGAATNAAGNLVFNGGTLRYTGANASTDRNFTINAGKVATFDVTANTLTLSGASLASTGGFAKTGAGTLTLTGSQLFTGTTTISAGKLALSGGGAISDSSAVNVAASGAIFDISAITASGETIGSLSGVSGSSVVLGAKKLTTGGDGASTTFAGVLSGSGGSLTKLGAGTMTLSGNNTFTGGTTITGGALSVAASAALGSESNLLTINGGATLKVTESFATSRATVLGGAGGGVGGTIEVATGKTLNFSSSSGISGSGSLIKTGAGTLFLEGTNNHTGGIYITAGTLAANSQEALGAVPAPGSSDYGLYLSGGATFQTQVGSWATYRQLELVSGVGNVDVTNGFSHQRNGLVTGVGQLDLVGTGTLILTGANTYTGGTRISNGTLQVNNSSGSATGTGAVTVANGGRLSGLPTAAGFPGVTGAIAGTVTVQLGGELTSRSGSTLTLGGLAFQAGSVNTFELGAATSTPLVNITGSNLFSLPGSGTSTIDIVNTGLLGVGTYRLFDYTGTAISDLSTLALASSNSGLYNLSLVNNAGNTSIDLAVTAILQQWKKGGVDTNWSTAGNWWAAGIPGGVGASATFLNNNAISGFGTAEAVTLDTDITLGSLVFQNAATAFTLGSSTGKILTLDDASGIASINVLSAPATANHVISVPMVLADNLTVDVDAGIYGLNLSGAISGSGKALTKTDTGPLTLSGTAANTYTGLTRVSGGTLNLNKTAGVNAIGSGGLQIDANTTVALLASNQIADNAAVTVNGTFALTTFSETIGGLGGGGSVTTGTGGVLTLNSSANSTFVGSITGTGGLAKAGSGILTLNGVNTYTGGTAISGGTLQVGADQNLGGIASNLTIDGGTLSFSGGFASARDLLLNSGGGTLDNSGNTVTLTGHIIGSGSLTKTGSGTLLLSHANTYSGVTSISGGVLQIGNAAALGTTGAGTTIHAGGELELVSDGMVLTEPLTLNGGTFCNGSGTNTFSGSLTLTANSELDADSTKLIITSGISQSGGSFGVTKNGPGIVELRGSSSFTGATHVQAGTLSLFNGAAIADTVSVVLHNVAGATLALNANETIGSLSGGGTTGGNLALGAFTLTTGDASDTSFGGSISGSGGIFVKQGSGTLTLTGSNTHTGGTTINSGAISVAASSALGLDSNNLTIGGGAILRATESFSTSRATALGGAGNGVGGTFEVAADKILTYTSGSVISGSGSLIKTGEGTLSLGGADTYTGGTYIKAGTLVSTSALAPGPQPPAGSNLYAHHIYDGATLQIAVGSWSTERQIELMGNTPSLDDAARIDITNGFTQQRNGLIYGAGKLNLVGTGTMIVTNANTYSGGTLIDNGVLQVNNSSGSATGTGAVTVASGGTLSGLPTATGYLGITGAITGSVLVESGGNLLTRSGTTLTLGGLTLEAGSLSTFQLGALTATPLVNVTGTNGFGFTGDGTAALSIVNTGAMGVGTYRLFDYAGTALTGLTDIALANQSSGSFNFSLVNNTSNTSIDLAVTAILQQWKDGNGNRNWSDNDNWWVAGGGPNAAGAAAAFLNNNNTAGFGNTETVTIDVSRTVGSVAFQNTGTAFTIGASANQALTLDNNGVNASIQVLSTPANANHTISAPIVLVDSLTVDIAAGNYGLNLSGEISGDPGLTKTGSGPLTLSGALENSFAGLTEVAAGTLNLQKTSGVNAIGSGGLQINPGATVALLASNQIADDATVAVNGTFALGTYSETLARLTGGGAVTTGSGSVLTLSGDADNTFIGTISGSGGLAKGGAGVLTLNGTNTYTGGTAINAGTLQVGADANLGGTASNITFNGGILSFSGGFSSARNILINSGGGTLDTSGSAVTLTGLISGSGVLTKTGAGTINLNRANSYTGATIIENGILQISHASALGTTGAGTTIDFGGELELNGSGLTLTEPLALNGGTLCSLANTNTYSGVITLTADSFLDSDAGTLIVTSAIGESGGAFGFAVDAPGTVELRGTNTFTGATRVMDGTLRLFNGAAISNSGSVILSDVAGATLELLTSETIGALSGGGATGGNLVLGAYTLTTGDASDTSFGGVISGSGGILVKQGTGTMTLTGSNTHTGGTTIAAGTLCVTASSALGQESNLLTIGGGAILKMTESFDTSRATVLGGAGSGIGGTFDVATGKSVDYTSGSVISGTGSLFKTGEGTLSLGGANTYTGGTYLKAGTLLLTSGQSVGPQPPAGSNLYAHHIYDGATLQIAVGSWTTERQVELVGDQVGVGGNARIDITNGFTQQRNGLIYGAGKLNLVGTGTMIVTNANTYTGGTLISNGVLQVNNSTGSATGTGSVTVANGGTLKGSTTVGRGIIAGTVTVQSGGNVTAFSGETLTLGGLTLGAGSLGTFHLGSVTDTSMVVVSGSNAFIRPSSSTATLSIVNTGTMGVGTYRLFDYNGIAFSDISTLALADATSGSFNLALVNNTGNTSIDLEVTAITQQWKKGGANTNWSEPTNWWAGVVPDGIGMEALFINNNNTAGLDTVETITLDSSRTVGEIIFQNTATAFAISGPVGQTLTLNGNGAGALISALATPTTAHHIISVPLILADDLTVDTAAGNYGLDLSGAISGIDQTLTKTGAGPLVLSGSAANTYTGKTTVVAGTLSLNKTAGIDAIGSGGLQIDSGAAATWLASNQIADSATVTVNGTMALGGYAETIAGLSGGGAVTTGSGGMLTLSSSTDSTFTGTISGAGGFAKAGSSTLTLNGTNTYTGGTLITAGTLEVGADSNLGGAGNLTFGGGTLHFSTGFSSARNVVLNSGGGTLDTHGTDSTLTGVISGSGTLTKAGDGTLAFTSENTYTGATTLSGGVLSIAADNRLGAVPGTATAAHLILDGGTLAATESFTLASNRGVQLASSSGLDVADAKTLTYSGVIAGGGGITKSGSGTLELLGSNTFGGDLTLNASTLVINSGASLGSGGQLVFAGNGTLKLAGNVTAATPFVFNAGATATLNTNGHSLVQGGSFSGGGALTKTGSGTLTLTATNTYTGATTVSGGTLSISSNANLGAVATGATLYLNGGATLQATASLALDNSGANRRNLVVGNGGGIIETQTSGHVLSVGGIISGTGNLTVSGAGKLVFTGENTLNGEVFINSGSTLQEGDGGTGGSFAGVASITNNGALICNRSDNHLFSNLISGTGTFTKAGSSTLTLTGTNTYTGTTTINGGALQLGDGFSDGSINSSSAIINNGALVYNVVTSASYTGVISGSGTLTKAGVGSLTLSGINSYSGTTTLTGGTLNIAADSSLGTAPGAATPGHLVLSGGTLATTQTFSLDSNRGITTGGTLDVAAGTTLTYGGIASGAGTLTKSGAGTLVLTGANTFTGLTTVSAGTLWIGDGTVGHDGAVLGNIVNNGSTVFNVYGTSTYAGNVSGTGSSIKDGPGTLIITGLHTASGQLRIDEGTFQLGNETTNGVVAGSAELINNGVLIYRNPIGDASLSRVISGTGQLIVNPGSGVSLTLAGTNTYSGATTVTSGTLKLGNAAALGTTAVGTAVASGAALDLFGQTVGAETLTLSGTGIASAGALLNGAGAAASLSGNITLAASSSIGGSGSMTLSGVISGNAMALTKVGTGITTLSGTNTYTGATAVSAGTLNVTGSLHSSSSVALASGATLTGTGTVGGLVTVATGTGEVTAGNGTSGTLNLSGGLTFDGAGIINIGTFSNYASTSAIATGALTANGAVGSIAINLGGGVATIGSYNLISYTGGSISGTNGFSAFTLGATKPATGSRQTGSLFNTGSVLQYVVTGAVPYWSGLTSTEWSTNTIGGSSNWKLNTDSSVTDFLSGDTVLFNDNATGTTANISVADVTIAGVSVSGSKHFTFTGNKAIAGTGTLAIDSTGSLTIQTANSFSGGTTLTAGTLKLGNNSALGTGLVTLNGGTLSSDSTSARTLSNTLAFGGNATLGDATNSGALTFSSGTRVDLGGATRVVTVASDVTLSGFTNGGLTKGGPGTLTLALGNDTTGNTTLLAGTLQLGAVNLGSTSSSALVFAGNSTLRVTADIPYAVNRFEINNGVTATIDTNYSIKNGGVISGGGSLTKTGTGTVTLIGTNTYSGTTTVSAGSLRIGDGTTDGSIASSSAIVNHGALVYNLIGTQTVSQVISGAGSFEKLGAGIITLTGSNTYTGWTTISGGTLQIGNGGTSGTIGYSSGITNNGTLIHNVSDNRHFPGSIGGTGTVVKEGTSTLTLSGANTFTGQIYINNGAVSISANNNLGAGSAVTLAGGTLIATTNDFSLDNGGTDKRGIVLGTAGGTINTATTGKHLTVTGIVSGSGTLTKTGAGTLILSGENTYTGATIVNGGTLSIAADSGLGAVPGAETAGQLVFAGSTLAATDSFTLASNRGIQFTATSTLDVANAETLTYSGVIVGAGGLNKTGAGTLELFGRNQFEGETTHYAGTMVINSSLSLGSYVSGQTGGQLVFAGNSTLRLADNVNAARSFVFNSGITATIDTDTHSFNHSGLYSGAGGLTKAGAGTLTLNGTIANTYTGLTTVTAGELYLNKPANNLAIGGNLTIGDGSGGANADMVRLLASGQIPSTAAVLIDGTSGQLDLHGNTQTLGSLADTGTVTANGSSLDIGTFGALTVGDATISTTFSGAISGPGGTLTKQGSGSLVLAGTIANTYSGLTTVTAGELVLGKSANTPALSGNLTIGDGTGGANADRVKLLASGQLLSTAAVLIHGSSGKFDLNGNTQTIASLSDTGSVVSNGSSLALGAGALTVGDATSTTFSGAITGSGGTLTKQGSGTLVLAGSSSFTGATTVAAGVLNIRTNSALGTTAGGVTVTSGAAIELQGGITVGAEALTLDGTGVSSGGALRSVSGNNNYGGDITLTGNSKIASDAEILTLTGAISGDFEKTFATTGDITAGGTIGGSGGIIKTGTGKLVFTNLNTFTGPLGIAGGTVQLATSGSLGSGSNVTVSASGLYGLSAVLDLNGLSASIGSLTLGGPGSGGAKTNTVQTGAGTLTLGGDVLFNGDQGNQGINSITGHLDLGGATRSFTVNGSGSSLGVSAGISGSGGLTKAGPGTLALTGSNTYSGDTIVSGGKLLVGVAGIGSIASNVTVQAGGTLGGTGTIGGDVNIQSGGTHAPGNSIGLQTITENLNYGAGSVFEWEMISNTTSGRGTNFDAVNVNGSLSISSTAIFKVILNVGSTVDVDAAFWRINQSWDVFDATGLMTGNFEVFDVTVDSKGHYYTADPGGHFSYAAGTLTWNVPEPSTALAGLLMAAGLLRRRREKALSTKH